MRKQIYQEPLMEVAESRLENGIASAGETIIMDGGEGFDLGFLEDETLF